MNVRYGTQDRNGMLMYYVSLEPGMYKTFGTQFDAFWCCTGTGSEEYAKLNDSIYFHDDRVGVCESVHSLHAGLEGARAQAGADDKIPGGRARDRSR